MVGPFINSAGIILGGIVGVLLAAISPNGYKRDYRQPLPWHPYLLVL